MADYGIRVSSNGVDATNLGTSVADRTELPINMRQPMAKLDTSKSASFQNISLTFNTDPPEPSGAGEELRTIVYQFPTGYTYAPTVWSLAQVTQRPNSPGNYYQNFWQNVGILRTASAFDFAALEIDNDAAYVYLRVRKYYNAGSGGTTNNLIGCKVLVRVYVFAEDYNNET